MKPKIKNAKIRGELHPPSNLALLTQDMLEVELPNGIIIDVGWYPEHDRNGEYAVIVFEGHPDKPLSEPYYSKDPEEVIRRVESLAKESSRLAKSPVADGSTAQKRAKRQTR
jgi:hypothetical protein